MITKAIFETGMRSAAVWIMGALMVSSASGKTWKDRFGRTFEAEFVKFEGEKVVLAFPDGKVVPVAVGDLSAEDQRDLVRQLTTSMPIRRQAAAGGGQPAASQNFGRPWPREVRMDGASSCKVVREDAKTGRYIYESPAYRFTADARITNDALRHLSVMFETTRKYALGLPLSLSGRQRDGKYDILLFGEEADYIQAGGPPGSAGCYVSGMGLVMVPMESLGLKKGDTGYSLATKGTNLVLIHELAHQLTPATYYAQGARGWFTEGLAEYFAATPYSWGYFAPDAHGNATKAYVTSTGHNGTGGRNMGTNLRGPKLQRLMLMDYSDFSGGNAAMNYSLGLLVTHYFFHMEGGGRSARMRGFLEGLQRGASGEEALAPLLGGGSFEKLEAEISAEWAKKGVHIQFGR